MQKRSVGPSRRRVGRKFWIIRVMGGRKARAERRRRLDGLSREAYLYLHTMTRRPARDPKTDSLRDQGVLNAHADQVSDKLFTGHEFFDARDVVQVKYEMVRRVEAEGASVTEAAEAFGFSRPSFYQAQEALRFHGLSGLLPKKRGPRSAHKLGDDVVEFLLKARADEPEVSSSELATRIEARFAITVHSRSVERALARRKKKRR